jgi:hypothetical protein
MPMADTLEYGFKDEPAPAYGENDTPEESISYGANDAPALAAPFGQNDTPVDSPNVAGAKAAWQALNKPGFELPEGLTREEVKAAYPFLGDKTADFVAGVDAAAKDLAGGLTSPLGLATIGLGTAARSGFKLAKAGATTGAAYFGYEAAKGLPEQIVTAEEKFKSGDVVGGTRAAVGAAASAVIAPSIAGHIVPLPMARPPVPFVEQTAKALGETPKAPESTAVVAPMSAQALAEVPPAVAEIKAPEAPKIPETVAPVPAVPTPEEINAKYPTVSGYSDGRVVRKKIPNTASIEASLNEWEVVPGVRDIPMSEFSLTGEGSERIDQLAEQIKESGEINPLIVVMDKEGLYILEGATRAEALYKLGAKSFPAKLVIDTESIAEGQSAKPQTPIAEDMGAVLIDAHEMAAAKVNSLQGFTDTEREIMSGKLEDWVRDEAEKYQSANGTLDGFSPKTVIDSRTPTAIEFVRAEKRGGGAGIVPLDQPTAQGGTVGEAVPGAEAGPATAAHSADLSERVADAVDQLPPDERQTVRDFMATGEGEITQSVAAKLVPLLAQRGITAEDLQPIFGMGGAIPAEFELRAQSPTSIKNAQVDIERRQRGLPPAVQPARRSFGEAWDHATAKVDQDPTYQDRLINELRDKPRALTDTEDAALLQRQIDLQNEYGKATRDLVQAVDDGRVEDAADQNARVADLSDRLLDLYNIGKKAGTETGRGLSARRMMVNEDFSLASLELQKRAAKGGQPLTDSERTELQKIAADYKVKSEALEKSMAERESRAAETAVKEALDRIARETPKVSPPILRIAERIVAGLDKRADAARIRLQEKFSRTSAGVDPTILFDVAEIGAAKIAHIGLDFAKWSAEMIKDLGDQVKPYLGEAFKKSQALIDREADKHGKSSPGIKRAVAKMDSTATVADATASIKSKVEGGKGSEIANDVQKLARGFVEQGIKDRNALIDAVHNVLKESDPEITRRDAMDAISGYGKYKLLSKDEISVQLRDLKGQMQQVAKLEDMQAGQAPSKTGIERRTPSDEERHLIKQVEEAKKKGGYTVTDPATQLRSALQATQRRLENQISDLGHEIENRARIVREKAPSPTSPEIERLRAQRDQLREQRDQILEQIRENDPVYQAEVEARKLNTQRDELLKSIAKKERRLREGDLAGRQPQVNRPLDPVLEPLRQQRDALSEQLAEARKKPAEQKAAEALQRRLDSLTKAIAEREAKVAAGDISSNAPAARVNRPLLPELEQAKQKLEAVNARIAEMRKAARPVKSPEEIALKAFKTRAKNRIAELEKKLKAGDFSKRMPRELKLDPEATKLKFEMDQITRKFHEGLMRDRLARRTIPKKILAGIGEAMNTVRSIMTSFDLSAVLRQGGFIALGHPIRAVKSFPAMFRALASEQGRFRVEQEIMARKNYPLYQRSKLYLSEHGQKLSQMEEAYMSRWADKIPGVAASQRAYTTFLNRLRADSFDAMAATLSRDGKPTPAEADAVSNFINVATGRGNIGLKENALVGLNTIFFAPRYVASRFNLLGLQPLYRGTAKTRALVASEYARYLIGLGVVYGLSKAAGASIEVDPRSSDFGKLRFGHTRVDPMSGLAQATVFISRLASGETKTLKGTVVQLRGEKLKYGRQTEFDVMARFARTKLSPVFGTGVNLLTGTDVVGQAVTPASIAQGLLVPLAMSDIYKAMLDQGIPAGTAISLLSIFGMGVQTFDATKKKPKP